LLRYPGLSLLAAMLASLPLAGGASADPVRVAARFVTDEGELPPLAGKPLRITVGSGAALRKADAGNVHTTDQDGRVAFDTEAPVVKRKITLDNPVVGHDSWFVEVGIELDIVGRPTLYIVQLDMVRDGAVGVMTASMKGKGGEFDAPLVFHADTRSWSFPDEPDGWRLTDIGARLVSHDMTGSPEAGWTIKLEIAKQNFTVR
jgi:hypothetical protein